MNINRSNNRRRGRGNNRGSGGGNQTNRIDNRARGNAPQLLEKYKKLAHDASLNDDRVQTEYYLQFADHYFRVIADGKVPKDEHRTRRDNDRDDTDDEDQDDRTAARDDDRTNSRDDDRGQQRRGRSRRDDEDKGQDRGQGRDQDKGQEKGSPNEGNFGSEGDDAEQQDNPFVREAKTRKPRGRPKRKVESESEEQEGLNPDMLPPAIARAGDDEPEEEASRSRSNGKARPKTTRTGAKSRSRPADDGDAEGLEAVG